MSRVKHQRHGEFVGNDRASPEYWIWVQMRQRCQNPKAGHYDRYGGRGIKVCDRWENYESFLADMGRRPSDAHSLDRYPDNDGDYEPKNCRWATMKDQANNRQNSLRVAGLTITEAAAALGMSYGGIYRRVKSGWTDDAIVNVACGNDGRRSTNRFITSADGRTQTLTEWARQIGCEPTVIWQRLKNGMSEARAVSGKVLHPKGEAVHNAKLTADQARYIRSSEKSGRDLSRELGVSDGLIYAVRAGRIWVGA